MFQILEAELVDFWYPVVGEVEVFEESYSAEQVEAQGVQAVAGEGEPPQAGHVAQGLWPVDLDAVVGEFKGFYLRVWG